MAILDDVKTIWTDIISYYDDTQIQDFINLATKRVDVDGFCGNGDLAVAYLTCHMASLSLRDGEAGSVGAKKEGDLSINFSPGLSKDGLDQTAFGREFKQMREECYLMFGVALT